MEGENDLEEIELRPQEEEEARNNEGSERRMGRALPSRMCFLFLPFVFLYVLSFGSGDEGRSWGHPTMTAQAGPGWEKVKLKKPAVVREGNGKAAAMALRPHVAGYK